MAFKKDARLSGVVIVDPSGANNLIDCMNQEAFIVLWKPMKPSVGSVWNFEVNPEQIEARIHEIEILFQNAFVGFTFISKIMGMSPYMTSAIRSIKPPSILRL